VGYGSSVTYPPQGQPPGYGPGYPQGYGQGPGYGAGHGYGGPPPPYGPQRPSTAIAYVCVVLFLLCGAFALIGAIVGWDGSSDSADMMASLIGIAFTEDLTGNVDFAISTSLSVACTTLIFALVLISRLEFVRWVLGFVGAVTSVYYIYAIIWLLSNDGEEVIAVPLLAWVLWTGATVLVLLPQTRRAMRGYQQKAYGHY
jgi:hypothetical protein